MGVIVKNVNLRDRTLFTQRFHLDENLPDQRCNRANGARQNEAFPQDQVSFREARQNALADGPDGLFTRQIPQRSHDKIDHHIVELPHQSLVGTKHHRGDCPCTLAPLRHRGMVQFTLAEARDQTQLHRAIVIIQSAHRQGCPI